jgi:hypothetical protein
LAALALLRRSEALEQLQRWEEALRAAQEAEQDALAFESDRGQQQVIEYLLEENRVLREKLGGRRLRLTDAQRRRLAVRARVLERRALTGIACIVTPDTLRLPRN